MDERKSKAAEEARPFTEEATRKKQDAARKSATSPGDQSASAPVLATDRTAAKASNMRLFIFASSLFSK